MNEYAHFARRATRGIIYFVAGTRTAGEEGDHTSGMSLIALSDHVIVNGRLLPHDEAQISLFSQALFFSFGVYESIQIEGGRAFHLDEHLDRLFQSAYILQLPMPYTRADIRGWFERLAETDHIRESLLRIVVFGPNDDEDTLVYILPLPLPTYPETYRTEGAAAITFEGTRPLPQAKTLNTLINYLALRRARQVGAHEAFLINPAGCLTEGSRSNLFVLDRGRLITPPAEEVLSGITRDLVWRLAEARGIEVVEESVVLSELHEKQEMFVTSTSMHIMPIITVDGKAIGSGRIGPVTRTLIADFEAYYLREMGREAAIG